MKIIAWSGHRPELFRDATEARSTVFHLAEELRAEHQASGLQFLVGGQRGVDTWAALAAQEYQVPFELILPLSIGQFDRDWTAPDRQDLRMSAERAVRVHVVGVDPDTAYRERNRLLATRADLLVVVWTGITGGGTAETVAFARTAGTAIREIRLALPAGPVDATGRGV